MTTSTSQKLVHTSSSSVTPSWKQLGPSLSVGSQKVLIPSTQYGNPVPVDKVSKQTYNYPRQSSVPNKQTNQTSTTTENTPENSQNVFEQIMKTPSIFQEAASQITQPKKYSDAVGKKPSISEASVAKSGYSTVNGGSSNGGNPGAQYKINLANLAPGTKPVGLDQPMKPPSGSTPSASIVTQDTQQKKTSPWNGNDLSKENESDFNISGENISPCNSLGPIAPPSRISKPVNVSPKNQQVSPQRLLQTPPVAKSPLLGPAPPGLLPLPDKAVFRPIHPEGLDLQNSVPTQVPTPLRNNRPPLLATPPGFPPTQLMQGPMSKSWPETAMCRSPLSKRVQPQPSSPFQGSTDSDKGSPNKSPLQLIPPPPPPQPMHGKLMPSSNFNPNAPSFVPMIPQTTSSILGNPPPNLKYVGINSSILGSAPQLPTTMGPPAARAMTSPAVLSTGGHPPPPPPPPPPAVPPLVNNQPSLLGNPPFHLLVPQSNPNVLPNRPPNPVYFSNQFDSNVPPPPLPPPIMHNVPPNATHFPPQGMLPHDHIPQHPDPYSVGVVTGETPPMFPGYPTFPNLVKPETLGGNLDPKFNNWNQFETCLISQPSPSGPGELGILDMNITGRVEDKVLGDTMSPYPHQLEGDQNLPSPSAFSRVTPTSIMSAVMRGGDREGNNLLVDMSNAQKPTDISLSETLGNSMLPTGIITSSSVWTYSLGGSEDAGWNKPGDGISVDHVSDWPVLTSTSISLNTSPTTSSIVTTSGDMMITLHDDLETVLERLGLGKYYHLFQKNEIDLHALKLMSEKDFTEVGIPKGPRIKLLNAVGRRVTDEDESFKSEKEQDLEEGNNTLLSSSSSSRQHHDTG